MPTYLCLVYPILKIIPLNVFKRVTLESVLPNSVLPEQNSLLVVYF